MNDTYEAGAGSSASPSGLALDAELPPVQGVEGTDRTMLVVQYALAAIAAAVAILLPRVT